MLLTSVVIVLREVLEAMLLLSLFMVIAAILNAGYAWLRNGAIIGLIGAIVYGVNMEEVSEWFEGVGQEIVNASLQFAILPMLLIFVFCVVWQYRGGSSTTRLLTIAMTSCTALAIVREGSEIFIYLAGFLSAQDLLGSVLIGSFIGAAIGLSAGVLFYFLLRSQSSRWTVWVAISILCFVGAGMSSQATRELIQADWISSAGFIWDSSRFIPESSVLGQVLYAFVGYDSTPAAVEVAVYAISAIAIGVAAVLAHRMTSRRAILSQ